MKNRLKVALASIAAVALIAGLAAPWVTAAPTSGLARLYAQYNASLPTVVSGNFTAVQADSSGRLLVNVAAGTGSTVTANQGTAAVAANRWPFYISDGTNVGPTMDAAARKGFVQLTDGTDSALVTAGGLLQVDGSGVTQPISGTITANAGTGSFTVAQATATNLLAQVNLNQTGTANDVDIATALPTGANVIGAVTQSGTWNATINAALPAGSANIGDVDVVTLPALVAGSAIVGKVGIDQTTPGTTNLVQVGGSLPAGANNIGDVDVLTLPALATGSNVIGAVTQSGTWNATINTALPAGAANIGDVDIASAIPTGTNTIGNVVPVPSTSGGLSVYSGQLAATVTNAKATAGQIYTLQLLNTTAAVAYLQCFDLAAGSVTLGTTAPTESFGLAASQSLSISFGAHGIAHATAISCAGTTTRTGSTGAAIDVNIAYK